MSRESISANATMEIYLREQCDNFLRTLQVKIMGQVSDMMISFKLDMCKEINKTVNAMIDEFLTKSNAGHIASEITPSVYTASEISSDVYVNSTPTSLSKLHSTDSLDSETFYDADDVSSDGDDKFDLSSRQKKKIRRREQRDNVQKLAAPRTSSVISEAGFSGKVPDAFIYRCSKDSRAEFIKDYLNSRGIRANGVVLIR